MLSQIIINGVVGASIYLGIAISFSLIYTTTRFFHFAHGVIYTAGAYFTYALFKFGLPFWVSIPLAIALSALLGCLIDISVYKPLRDKRSSSLVLMLASLGIYVVLQNLISMVFGDDTKSIRTWEVREGLLVLGARITPVQIVIIGSSVVLAVGLYLFLKRTRFGREIRAVASDPELARISGINTDRVFLGVFAIGSALAGIAGILVALDVDMTPTMGMHALMMGVVAVIIGGSGSIPGVALGALLLGFAQHLGAWYVSSQWQDAIAFIILLIFLIFRPQGFFGKKAIKSFI